MLKKCVERIRARARAGAGWEIARGVGDRAMDHDERDDRSGGGSIVRVYIRTYDVYSCVYCTMMYIYSV